MAAITIHVQVPSRGWLHSVLAELAELAPPSNWSISRVPFTLRVVKPEAYTPQIISIGPLHHGEKNLQSMEFHKLHYMFSLLRRNPNAFDTLDACGMAIERLDRQVRACYSESIKFTTHELARILLVDGCFILELFLRFSLKNLRLKDDPVFNTSWIISTLQRDLALLENQIPFFVLQWLFDVAVMKTDIAQEVSNLPELALAFFKSILYRNQESVQSISRSQFFHLLGLIHDSYLPPQPAHIQDRHAMSTQPFVYSASSLREVGIHFKRDTTRSQFDLLFERGVLKIPPLLIHESTDSIFRNLIAFEQIFHGSSQFVTSYFIFMAYLVSTDSDTELLEHKGIIENHMGGWENASFLFNDMSKQVVLGDFHLAQLCRELNQYNRTAWDKYETTLKRVYFRTPWTVIALIASCALLLLVLVGAVVTVLSYYRP
ncbi:hypothetical protein Tsubulata_008834 [Turnera subulata]|uniref:Uncharacterized protein n=1 Tax=Turnera subulata TaxID=218843 RepID=A0A9Q0F8P2_9ROSI|nr:hypothetical protein Tsubulata_008834 [Turnera subulata]